MLVKNDKDMRIKSLWAVLLFLPLLFCLSCHQDEVGRDVPSAVRLRFSIVATGEGIVNTRSATDATINNVYVLVFGGDTDDSELKTWAEATPAGGGIYNASLDHSAAGGKMYVFANIEADMAGGTGFPEHITLGELKAALKVQLNTSGTMIIQNPRFAPMVGGSQVYDPDSGVIPVFELQRATAKVIVRDSSGNASYVIQGANLGNAPLQGYVFTGMGEVTMKANYAGLVSGSNYSVETMICGVRADKPTETEPLYLFESPAKNETFVIVKGEYDGVTGYHRLDLKDKDGNSLNITRNYQYVIHINKIRTGGYRTAQEAIANTASNRGVDWSVEVTDPSSHDVISNGKQYLGVSNSQLIVYQTGEIKGLVATKASYTVESGWLAGSITAVGDGLSLTETLGKTWTLPVGNITDKEIKITCTAAFSSGYLVIRVGDLSKVVRIMRNPNLSAIPDEMEFNGLSIGDCSQSGAMKSMIRFAEQSGVYADDANMDVFASQTGDLYASVLANVGYQNNITERDGEFYVSSAKDEGRTKVVFHQEKMDVYTGSVQIAPYTYVATFHRWNQTAERIIRVKTIGNDPNVKWTATVVVGMDFIWLSDEKSPDQGITTYPYGCDNITTPTDMDNPQWTTDNEIEANCQITRGKQMLTGHGNSIYFRVGLKSQLANETSKPRYGLIALTHKDGIHLIYVRQGEAADYLMRPTDPMDSYASRLRTEAVKISPYNVTVSDDHKGENYYDVPQNGGVWTDYPSQGGYLFKGTGDCRAFRPVGVPVGSLGFGGNGGVREVCPVGFRLPNDTGDAAVTSELRQSFWLHPQDGIENSNFDNLHRGYIADGYYDRRPMRIPNTQGRSYEGDMGVFSGMVVGGVRYDIPTLVGDGAYTGYAGTVLYNPITYASIFVPANGSIDNNIGILRRSGTGSSSNIWSSTTNYYLAIGYYYTGSFVFDNYRSAASLNGFSIRGVMK